MKKTLFIIFCLIAICTNAFAAPTLTLESKTTTAGSSIKLALSLANGGGQVASISTDISYDSNIFTYVSSEIGVAASSAGKEIMANDLGGKIRVGIFSMTNGNVIGDGVVGYINLTVKSTATGTASLTNTASGSNSNADDIVITGNAAQISFSGSTTTDTVNTYLLLTDRSGPVSICKGPYFQIVGSAGGNTITLASGAKVSCSSFTGNSVINIEDYSFDFKVYRSGATVYFKSANIGTLITIPATLKTQTLNFTGGTSYNLVINNGKVMLGNQEITSTETSF